MADAVSNDVEGGAGEAPRGARVERDRERFKRFHPCGRPAIPPGYEADIDFATTGVLMARRIRELRGEPAAD